ncbi:8273_t:CDS:2 [Cetraspora pellucida]|uniref:8273_t:CDS:1 n=1 Tax=Cetraspora pellucida TaxID=1433469 RepID=A0A9N9I511_9GLOM|nr:8273_t:CDS:2 [Cetraspora pellucida]
MSSYHKQQQIAIRNESRKKRKSPITEEQQLGYRKSESKRGKLVKMKTSLACQLNDDDSEAVANLRHNYCSTCKEFFLSIILDHKKIPEVSFTINILQEVLNFVYRKQEQVTSPENFEP